MSNSSRRKLLKSIAAGSGAIVAGKSLPESWSRPVVDSVILPAHAQTSGLRSFFGGAAQVGSISHNDTMLATVAGGLINEAHAADKFNGTLCAKEMSDGIEVQYQNRKNTVLRKGVLNKTGGLGMLNFDSKSPGYDCVIDSTWNSEARVREITDDYFEVNINFYSDGWRTLRVLASSKCDMPKLDGEYSCDED